MKKILIVTTRFPFPLFSGDKLRIYNISKFLSKKYKIDLIYTGSKKNFKKKIKFINKTIFIKTNVLKNLLNILYFFLKGKPLQVGYFFSSEMKKKITQIQENYSCIIFHLIRSSEHLDNSYKGKKILEMTDIISKNYSQLFKKLNFFNPLKYIYFLEKSLLSDYEKKMVKKFDYTALVSKSDSNYFNEKKKVKIISNGTELKKKRYKFKLKNKDIVFIGNINYHPNKIACVEFINRIMPKLEAERLNINFRIIGNTSERLKRSLEKHKKVFVHNNVKNTENFCKNAICGISNLSVAGGIQNKILEYMRIGLPTIVSKKCFESLNLTNNIHLLVYKNHNQFVNQIIKLKNNKKFANKISNNSFREINKNFNWNKILKKYKSLI